MTRETGAREAGRTRRGIAVLAAALATLLAGCGGDNATAPLAPEEDGVLYNVAGTAGEPGRGHDDVLAIASRLYWPQDIVMTSEGTLLIADWNNHVIRGVRSDGTIYHAMGSGIHGDDTSGPALQVNLNHPDGVAVGPDGNVYVSGWHNWKIKMWDRNTDLITSVVGTDNGFSGDGGPALSAAISLPSSVVWDPSGNMYVSDQGNTRIRMVDPAGIIMTFAGGPSGYAEGIGTDARFAFPTGTDAYPGGRIDISADAASLYVADTKNNRIRRIDRATREVTTIGGTGAAGYAGDGGPATAAEFDYPTDVACTPAGDLYVADSGNNVIRKIDANGIVTTVAGTGAKGSSPTGTLATQALMDTPSCVYYHEATQTLYISDTYNCQVKRVRLPD